MYLDFCPPQSWHDLNDGAKELLGAAVNGLGVKGYLGVSHAISEVTLGLLRQFPHKKKVAFVSGIDPTLEQPMLLLSREGALVERLPASCLSDVTSLQARLADCLFVLVAEDDPLLGRLYQTAELEKFCLQQKIFIIRVSHAHHRYLPLTQPAERHFIKICAMGVDFAIVMHSERVNWPPTMVDSLYFSPHLLRDLEKLKRQEVINPVAIQKFESSLPAESQAFFKAEDTARIFDRAVIYWTDMDGLAVLERLLQRLGLPIENPGEARRVEATSLHRWRGLRTMEWLKEFGFSEPMIRGTIIIDQKMLNADLVGHLTAIRREILAIQLGT